MQWACADTHKHAVTCKNCLFLLLVVLTFYSNTILHLLKRCKSRTRHYQTSLLRSHTHVPAHGHTRTPVSLNRRVYYFSEPSESRFKPLWPWYCSIRFLTRTSSFITKTQLLSNPETDSWCTSIRQSLGCFRLRQLSHRCPFSHLCPGPGPGACSSWLVLSSGAATHGSSFQVTQQLVWGWRLQKLFLSQIITRRHDAFIPMGRLFCKCFWKLSGKLCLSHRVCV